MKNNYSYQGALEASERIGWRIEDIIGGDKRLDFTKPFMPESLAQVNGLRFSFRRREADFEPDPRPRVSLHVRPGRGIHPALRCRSCARPQLSGDDYRVRALLQFAGEEAKHIHLFKQFRRDFDRGFGTRCEFIGPAEDVKKFVLSHSPLGVGIAILHIEWITLRHYIDSVRDDQELDPQFKSLLKHHWLEESQHSKIDTLIVEELAVRATDAEIDLAFEEYGKIGAFLDDGIKQQTEFNVVAFEQASGRKLSQSEREQMFNAVLKGMRWTYLGTGMTHPNFLATCGSDQAGSAKADRSDGAGILLGAANNLNIHRRNQKEVLMSLAAQRLSQDNVIHNARKNFRGSPRAWPALCRAGGWRRCRGSFCRGEFCRAQGRTD